MAKGNNKPDTGLFSFLKEVYHVWDGSTGQFLNLLSFISAVAAALILLKVIDIPDSRVQTAVVMGTASVPLLIILIAIYKVWRNQKNVIAEYISAQVAFSIQPELRRISLDKYKMLIQQRIETYKVKMADAPDPVHSFYAIPRLFDSGPTTKSDYKGWINTLENYLKIIEEFENKYSKTYVLDLILETSKTEHNIDVTVDVKGGLIAELSEIDFPEYPIRKGSPFMPYISPNIGGNIIREAPYRTHSEINEYSASCNLKYIKAGQKVSFMNELLITFVDDTVELQVIINSSNSGGNISRTINLSASEAVEVTDLMEYDSFEYIAGDYK